MLNNGAGSKKTTQLFLKFFLLKLFDNNIFNVLFIILVTLSIFRPLLSFAYPGWADNSTPPVLNMGRFNEISNFTYAENSNGLITTENVI